jgi:hypothetical protein
MRCHPEPHRFGAAGSHYAKDLCSWTAPLSWTGGTAVFLKRDITLSSLQRAAALAGRVAIELV